MPQDAPKPRYAAICRRWSGRSRSGFDRLAARDDLVDQTEVLGLVGGHEMVAVERLLDLVIALAGVLDIDLVQAALQLDDVLRMTFDVRSLALEAAGRLMDHDPGVRRGKTHVLVTGGQKQRTHRRGLADAERRHRRLDELHRVVDRHA